MCPLIETAQRRGQIKAKTDSRGRAIFWGNIGGFAQPQQIGAVLLTYLPVLFVLFIFMVLL